MGKKKILLGPQIFFCFGRDEERVVVGRSCGWDLGRKGWGSRGLGDGYEMVNGGQWTDRLKDGVCEGWMVEWVSERWIKNG